MTVVQFLINNTINITEYAHFQKERVLFNVFRSMFQFSKLKNVQGFKKNDV